MAVGSKVRRDGKGTGMLFAFVGGIFGTVLQSSKQSPEMPELRESWALLSAIGFVFMGC